MEYGICIICHRPNQIWLDFLETFTYYDVYLIIDDNGIDYKVRYSNLKKVKLIQVEDSLCKINGFTNMNFLMKKQITGWEKAMYYFSSQTPKYKQLWFIEDDVFFYNENTLQSIDAKYPNGDLLSNSIETNTAGKKDFWHWRQIIIKFPPPYYWGMMCAVRISDTLLATIKAYAYQHKTLFFLEALFPTLCKTANLVDVCPEEFKNIVYSEKYKLAQIDTINLYHPVKDIAGHNIFRLKCPAKIDDDKEKSKK